MQRDVARRSGNRLLHICCCDGGACMPACQSTRVPKPQGMPPPKPTPAWCCGCGSSGTTNGIAMPDHCWSEVGAAYNRTGDGVGGHMCLGVLTTEEGLCHPGEAVLCMPPPEDERPVGCFAGGVRGDSGGLEQDDLRLASDVDGLPEPSPASLLADAPEADAWSSGELARLSSGTDGCGAGAGFTGEKPNCCCRFMGAMPTHLNIPEGCQATGPAIGL
mmetsp:Transcript_122230/g.342132  ORF Transcript_122230/g.342132 Transcript_122230/m.342132 type:complete len:218 (+) Transcript_122230:172-825(+)